MDVSLFFAGTAGSVPTARRGLPALLLRAGGERILFDCGEGTQQQLLRSVGLPDLGAVFITHFHLDHWLGLLGMIKTFDLRARERPLTDLRPARPGAAVRAVMRPVIGRTGYPLELVELEPHAEVRFGSFLISPFPVKHRVEAYGYAFVEDERPGRFDVDAARELGVPEGPASGRLQRGETVGRRHARAGDGRDARRAGGSSSRATRRRARRSRSSPTAPTCSSTRRRSWRTSATARARPGTRPRARRRRSPATPASSCSRSPTSPRATSRARCATRRARVFPSTVVPRDFDEITVPFPERGEPALAKAEREPEPEPAAAP